ncbi:hypothetical protein PInf_008675 [Phytophthora infestans]|nr:hypothetical protein PInf_008675 [Phytophthora infestans]
MAAADTTEAVSSPAARSPDEEATHSSGEGSNPEYTEQGSDNACIPEDPELDTSVNSSESGRHIGVDAFDTEGLIDAMRTEVLFGPLATDDINVSSEPFPDDGESDDEDDAVASPSAACVEYESEIESDTKFKDESELFRQDDDAMRQLGLSGELQLDSADDLYNGTFGRTKSAAAFPASLLGMFFHFLPKALWVRITDETNAYRLHCIPSIAEKLDFISLQLTIKARKNKCSH